MELLEIVVAKHHNGYYQDREWISLPDEKIFHTVITDQEFVHHVYEIVSSLETIERVSSILNAFAYYTYWLRSATDTLTTLIYSGSSHTNGWQLKDTVTIKWVAALNSTLPLSELMQALHTRSGMPYC